MSLLFQLFGHLPLRVLHAVGVFAGWAVYLSSPTYRRHFKANLALAYPAAEAEKILPQAVAQAGRGTLELPWLWVRDKAEVVRQVTQVTGWMLVEEAWQQGQGILFLTPHLGCFEITAQYYARHRPMTVLYRKPKRAWLQPLIESGRGSANLHLAAADMAGVRRLLKALRRGEAVGMLPDQVPGAGEGAWAPFFGRPAYTMTLATRLSEMAGVTVILAWAERLSGGRGYHLHLSLPDAGFSGTIEERLPQMNRALEVLIRRCPEQYLWGYNRYKAPRGAPTLPQ